MPGGTSSTGHRWRPITASSRSPVASPISRPGRRPSSPSSRRPSARSPAEERRSEAPRAPDPVGRPRVAALVAARACWVWASTCALASLFFRRGARRSHRWPLGRPLPRRPWRRRSRRSALRPRRRSKHPWRRRPCYLSAHASVPGGGRLAQGARNPAPALCVEI